MKSVKIAGIMNETDEEVEKRNSFRFKPWKSTVLELFTLISYFYFTCAFFSFFLSPLSLCWVWRNIFLQDGTIIYILVGLAFGVMYYFFFQFFLCYSTFWACNPRFCIAKTCLFISLHSYEYFCSFYCLQV